MKTKSRNIVKFLVLLNVSIFSCSDQDINEISAVKDQEVFFEVSYVNNAWTKQFKGIIIDKDGKVKTYDNPVSWNNADEKKGLTAAQIQENLAKTTLSSTTVSTAELADFTAKIQSVGDSPFTKPVSVGADQGETSFYAYRYDADKLTYTPVLLSQTGDIETHRQDKSAIEISTWLAGILDKVY